MVFYILNVFLYLIFSYGIFAFLEKDLIIALGREDAFFENITALWLLIAAVFFLIKYIRDHSANDLFMLNTNKNIFYLLLALAFLFGFLEEISWGQRIFQFETPSFLKEANIQGEISIHNLAIFNSEDSSGQLKSQLELMLSFNRIFSVFCLLWCICIPLLNKYSSIFRRFLMKINMPIVPLSLGVFVIANDIIVRFIKLSISKQENSCLFLEHSLYEIKESDLAFLFLFISIYFFFSSNKVNKSIIDK